MALPGIISNGNIAYVRYEGFEVWHERMICGFIQNGEYLIVTPDFEFFVEQLSPNNLKILTGSACNRPEACCPWALTPSQSTDSAPSIGQSEPRCSQRVCSWLRANG